MSDRISITEFRGLSKMGTGTGKWLSDIAEMVMAKAETAQAGASAAGAGQKRYVVGIDPGVKTGFAVWDRDKGKFLSVQTSDFWAVFFSVMRAPIFRPENTLIVIEVAHHAPTFRHLKNRGLNDDYLSSIARKVGQVTREAQLLVDGFQRLGYTVQEQKPLGKAKKAEDDVQQFQRLTGWTERTSQHARDAARLCFQR